MPGRDFAWTAIEMALPKDSAALLDLATRDDSWLDEAIATVLTRDERLAVANAVDQIGLEQDWLDEADAPGGCDHAAAAQECQDLSDWIRSR